LPEKTTPEPPNPAPLHLIDAADLDDRDPPPREFVVAGLYPRKTAVLKTGDGGVGKSMLALQAAVCIRYGVPFLGRETVAGTALIYSCEDDQDELHRRLQRIQRSMGRVRNPPGRILLAPRVGTVNALIAFDARTGVAEPTDAFRALEAAATANGADFIVVDTTAQTFPGNENDRAAVTAYVNMMAGLAMRTNSCVLLLAHPPKATGAEYSGSTTWTGTVRARCFLRLDNSDGIRRYFFKLSKANYAPEFEVELVRDDDGVMWLAEKLPPTMADKINAYADLAKYKTTFLSALDILTRQGRAVSHSNRAPNYAPKVIIHADLGLGCSIKHLTAGMEALFKDEVIVAGAVVGKGSDRKPVYGIARKMPKNPPEQDTTEAEQDEAADPNVIDLNNFRSPTS
jgi:RecA-family ATPase